MATNDIKSLNDLFKETYGDRINDLFMEDHIIEDTVIARKLYPNAEKTEDGKLKIGRRERPMDKSGNALALAQSQAIQAYNRPVVLSVDIDEGEDKE